MSEPDANHPWRKRFKPQREERVCELVIWGVPENTKARFKIACARKGVTMKDAVIALLCKFANDSTLNEPFPR